MMDLDMCGYVYIPCIYSSFNVCSYVLFFPSDRVTR